MTFSKFIISLAIFITLTATASAGSSQRKINKMLDAIQNFEVPVSTKDTKKANKAADKRWTYFNKHKPDSLQAIRLFITEYSANKKLSDFAIIDMGYYLSLHGNARDKRLAVDALMLLDVNSEEALINRQQLFQYVISLTQTGDERLLPFITKQYLDKDDEYWGGNPMHPLTGIKGAILTAYMYGAMGEAGEIYLDQLLSDNHAKSPQIISALNWMGTPRSIPPVLAYIKKNQSYGTIAQALGFMIRVGGASGRDTIKTFPDFVTDKKALDYINRIMPSVEKVTGHLLMQQLGDLGEAPVTLSNEETEKHIQIMLDNMGQDFEIDPLTIMNSGLSNDYLLKQFLEIRRRTFWRLTREGWDDIQIMNMLINALQYKGAGQ